MSGEGSPLVSPSANLCLSGGGLTAGPMLRGHPPESLRATYNRDGTDSADTCSHATQSAGSEVERLLVKGTEGLRLLRTRALNVRRCQASMELEGSLYTRSHTSTTPLSVPSTESASSSATALLYDGNDNIRANNTESKMVKP